MTVSWTVLLEFQLCNPRWVAIQGLWALPTQANRNYTLSKGDLEVVVAKCNLILLSQNSITGCSLTSYYGYIIITGDHFRPDILLSTANNILYIIKISVGFETNINNNAVRKYDKYRSLEHKLSSNYHIVKFVNISISPLGIFYCDTLMQMYKYLDFNKKRCKFILVKLMISLYLYIEELTIDLPPLLISP